jgi:hypothetical protein
MDFMARCETFEQARKFRKHFSDVKPTPLMNFVDMIEELISIGDFELLKEVKEKYDTEINRDPTFYIVNNFTFSKCISILIRFQ